MRRLKKNIRVNLQTFIASILCLIFLNSCSQNQVAGTSTNTGNTITLAARKSDGSPAAYARLRIRESGFVPDSIPAPSLSLKFQQELIADSKGLFIVTLPNKGQYFFAAYTDKNDSSEVFWMDSVTQGNIPDTVKLQVTAILKGQIILNDSIKTSSALNIWIGFPGTDHFIALTKEGSFILDSLPPGTSKLQVIQKLPDGVVKNFQVKGWNTVSGDTVVLDSLPQPANISTEIIPAEACLENPHRILPVTHNYKLTKAIHLLNSIRLSSPAEWIEIDVCLGTWSIKSVLTQSLKGGMDLFSGFNSNYLLLHDSQQIQKLDTVTTTQTFPFPNNLAQSDYQAGRFYALNHNDSLLHVFPNENAWLTNQSDSAIALPNNFLVQRFAVGDQAIYYLSQTDSLRIIRYDIAKHLFLPPVTSNDFTGKCLGMAYIQDIHGEELYLLNDSKELFKVNVNTGVLLFKAKINMPDSLKGLAGPFQ